MAFTSKEALYTDVDPYGPNVGRVLPEGDADARFVLVGAGGIVTDAIAAKFNLDSHESVEVVDEAQVRAELVAANLRTYGDNARVSGGVAYNGLAVPEKADAVAPAAESDKAANISPKRR